MSANRLNLVETLHAAADKASEPAGLLRGRLLAIDGTIERHDGVQHLVVKSMQDYSPLLEQLDARSRDFK